MNQTTAPGAPAHTFTTEFGRTLRHGPERELSSGESSTFCLAQDRQDTGEARSTWTHSAMCSACFTGMQHTRSYHDHGAGIFGGTHWAGERA